MSQLQPVTDFLGNTSPTDLTSQDIDNVIDELNRANASVNVLGQVLSISNIVNDSYFVTEADLVNAYANISFPHNLSFVPLVNGSVTNANDGSIRILPALYHGATTSYFGKTAGATITIENVDSNNINVRIDILDSSGVGLFNVDAPLSFIFYCQQQVAATT